MHLGHWGESPQAVPIGILKGKCEGAEQAQSVLRIEHATGSQRSLSANAGFLTLGKVPRAFSSWIPQTTPKEASRPSGTAGFVTLGKVPRTI